MQASDFSTLVQTCCTEVLDSMYFTSVLDTVHEPGCVPVVSENGYAFSLHFDGDLRGTFGLSLDDAIARTLAANFLGEDEDSITTEEIAEVAGELTNMFCGPVVSNIEGSRKFALTHPEPLVPGLMQRLSPECTLVSTLATDAGSIQVWISLDPPDAAQNASQERP